MLPNQLWPEVSEEARVTLAAGCGAMKKGVVSWGPAEGRGASEKLPCVPCICGEVSGVPGSLPVLGAFAVRQ